MLDIYWPRGVVVSTQDFQSCDPGSFPDTVENFYIKIVIP